MNETSDELDILRETLAARFALPRREAVSPPTAPVLAAIRQMRQRRSSASASPRMTAALFQLRLGQPPDSASGLRRLCASLHQPLGWEQQRPIDDPRLLALLLQQVEMLANDPRRFARCYRALLASYFSMPPGDVASGHAGWRQLGEFLRRLFPVACPSAPGSSWQAQLHAQRKLLASDAPLQRHDADACRPLLHRLGVTSGGWLDRPPQSGQSGT